MTQEQLRMHFLSGVITEGQYKAKLEEKKSLNEHYVAGGIVGVGAINNPFEGRKKEKYEDAFEYFLNSKYELNEAEETKVEESMGNSSDEEKAQFLVDMTGMSYEDALMKVRQGAVMEGKEDGFTIAMNIQAVINDLLNMEGGQEALKLLEQIDEWNELVDMAANI